MREEILNFINGIAKDKGIEILYACESGSRAWGFPSPDSDYDIRFIYRHSKDWYLTVNEKKDSISVMPNEILDGSGWDIRKVLRLLHGSNLSPFEWLHSPIVYLENKEFKKELHELSLKYFQPKKAIHHYLGIATGMLEKEFKTDEVKIKKYFYVLRPLLAAIYVAKNNRPAPMEFDFLLDNINDDEVLNEIKKLLKEKETAKEGQLVNRSKILDNFVKKEMEHYGQFVKTLDRRIVEWDDLNSFYQKTIGLK